MHGTSSHAHPWLLEFVLLMSTHLRSQVKSIQFANPTCAVGCCISGFSNLVSDSDAGTSLGMLLALLDHGYCGH